MSVYLIRYRYPRELWQGLVMDPHDRREKMRKGASSVGIEIREVWYALGPQDVYWLVEASDSVAPLAFRIFDLSQGFVPEMEVIPLLTVEQAIEAAARVRRSISKAPFAPIESHAAGWPPSADQRDGESA
jgi:uncharacterized protein with GYD domain